MIDELVSQAVEKFAGEWPVLSTVLIVFWWLARMYNRCFDKLCEVLDKEMTHGSE